MFKLRFSLNRRDIWTDICNYRVASLLKKQWIKVAKLKKTIIKTKFLTLFDSITNLYQLYVNYPWKKDAYTVEKLPTTNESVTSKENIKTKNKELTMMKLEVFIYYKLY